jgi:anaerobic magnesium-protoporphyrin IX monomethyl ester cyclase
MNFLLINPGKKISYSGENKYFTLNEVGFSKSFLPPLGLLYIASSLEEEGCKVELIDYYCEEKPEEKIRKSLLSVDAVGLGVYNRTRKETSDITKTIKDIDPDIKIIIGGPNCTSLPKKTLEDIPSADICVQGEGEYAIKEIIKALNGKKELSEINGVFYRENGEIKSGREAEVIKDLDSLAFPSRHLLDKYTYGLINGIPYYKQKFTAILSSRGCPFKCRFCSRDSMVMKVYRERSAENVIKELQMLNEKYGSVIIYDENFLANRKRVFKIMDNLIENKTDIELHITGARVDSADETLYKKLKKANVKSIEYGLESGNQDVLDFYNKKITLDQIKKATHIADKMGFLITGSFIFGAPIETKKHIDNTINFAKSLPLDIVFFIPLSYLYGSDLWYEAEKDGKVCLDDGFFVIADKKRGLGNFTKEELEMFCKKAIKSFYMRPRYFYRQIFSLFKRRDYRFLLINLKSFSSYFL